MPVRLIDRQAITSIDQLAEVQQQQLAAAGKRYDGNDLPAGARLAGDPDTDEGSFGGFVALWKGVDGDAHLYDVWLYNVDSGTIFRAGTTEVVAEVIQFGLECSDEAIAAELGPALAAAQQPAG
jgi:hypothetical protein